jgi:hypothetical protein
MLGSIRTYFFEREKNKRLSEGAARKTQFKKDKPNHYGLLFDANQVDHRQVINQFAEDLRKTGNRVRFWVSWIRSTNPFQCLSIFSLPQISPKFPRCRAVLPWSLLSNSLLMY